MQYLSQNGYCLSLALSLSLSFALSRALSSLCLSVFRDHRFFLYLVFRPVRARNAELDGAWQKAK